MKELQPNDRYCAKWKVDPERPDGGTGLTPDDAFATYLEHFLTVDATEHWEHGEDDDGNSITGSFIADVEIWTIKWADEVMSDSEIGEMGVEYRAAFVIGEEVEVREVRCTPDVEINTSGPGEVTWNFEVLSHKPVDD